MKTVLHPNNASSLPMPMWAGNIRPEEILRLTKLDVHSLGKWRVNGALPQIGAWYDAFGITEENPMFLPVDKRVSIW